ncbi:MAG: trypsin-like peptidase domain-containing protein [Propionicimonas sp.]
MTQKQGTAAGRLRARLQSPIRLTRGTALAGAVGIALAGGLVGGGISALRSASGSCDAVSLATRSLPAVVTIFVTGQAGSGSGSGAVIAADGVIVTNDHVIHAGREQGSIQVLLNNGQVYPAKVVGTDSVTDLAVLSIDAKNLPTMPIANGETLQVGQPVVAMGAPLGLTGTITAGIVSALNRDVPAPKASGGTTVLARSIQTDASINPGNSGGPLLDCRGRLVGINTAISTVPNAEGAAGGGSVGIGFAVPADIVTRITQQLRSSGRAAHPWLGAAVSEVDASLAARLGTPTGLYVQQVVSGGPADEAGLQRGDIITRIEGQTASQLGLTWLLVNSEVGRVVTVDYQRGAEARTATVTLAEQP